MSIKAYVVFSLLLLTSCLNNEDIAGNRPNYEGECKDDCPVVDVSKIKIVNKENSQVYLRHGSYASGLASSMTLGPVTSISPNSVIQIPIINHRNFTHMYFYADVNMTEEIGRLIIKNTHPTNVTYCEVRVRKTGNFSSEENRVIIRSKYGDALVQFGFYDVWNSLPTQGWGATWGFNKCGTKVLNMPPSDKFMHLHFHDGDIPGTGSLLSEIVFQNTASNRINISKFIIK